MVISSSLSQQIFQALPTSLSSFFTSSTQPSCPLAMNDKAPTRTHIYSKLNGDFFFVPWHSVWDWKAYRSSFWEDLQCFPRLPKYKIFYFSKNGQFYRLWLPGLDFYWTVEVKRGLCHFDDCIMLALLSACQPLIFSTSGSHQSLVGSWETWTHCAIWISNVEMIIIWMLTDPHIIHNWSIRLDRSREVITSRYLNNYPSTITPGLNMQDVRYVIIIHGVTYILQPTLRTFYSLLIPAIKLF